MVKHAPQYYENLNYFNTQLNHLMSVHGTKQVDLVNALDIPKTTINGYVKGTSLPNMGNLQKLADYFNTLKSDLDLRFKKDADKHLPVYNQLTDIRKHKMIKMSNLDNKETMAQNIKYYLKQKGVSRHKLCDDLNIKYTTFCTWLQADAYPRIDKIEMMANYFNISKANLVEDKDAIKNDITTIYNQLHEKRQAKVYNYAREQLKEVVDMFSTNLKYLRKKYNMEQLELAYKLGRKSGSTISEWEKGSYTPKIKVLAQIADIFHVDLDDLMNKDLTNSQTKVDKDSLVEQIAETSSLLHISRQAKVYNYAREQLDEQLNEKRSIYVVDTSAAGEPIEYGDFDSEMIQTDVPAKADKAIHIKGDSMEPKIASNSIIFYHEQPTLEIGEIGIFEINGSAVTCKKYYVDYESKKIVLKSINPKYEPMYFARDQVRILGKVVF